MTMMEVQEAASIITEAIDPDAKVIFGTIKDEKLKKGELKITVIASGFNPNNKKLAFAATGKERGRSEKESGKGAASDIGLVIEKSSSKEKEDKSGNKEEDDWSMPAFLRRGKK